MPRYDYLCPANRRILEVRHGVDDRVSTWGDLCRRAGVSPGDTPEDAGVEKVIHPPALAFPRGDAELRSQGFTKLVRRDSGVYENVTASGDEARVVSADDPGSVSRLGLARKIGD